MLTVTIDSGNVEGWAKVMGEISGNPEPLLLIAMQVGQSKTQYRFANFGPGWAPRSPVTEKILEHKRPGSIGVLMYITGRLANATGLGGQVGTDGVLSISGNSAYLINNVPYGFKLQYGDPGGESYIEIVQEHQRISSRGRVYVVRAHTRNAKTRPIPPRPFLYWDQEDADDIGAYCKDYIEKKLRAV